MSRFDLTTVGSNPRKKSLNLFVVRPDGSEVSLMYQSLEDLNNEFISKNPGRLYLMQQFVDLLDTMEKGDTVDITEDLQLSLRLQN